MKKEWLKRGWKINEEINRLSEEREKAFADAISVTSYTGEEKVQTSHKNTSESKMIHYAAYIEQIDKRKKELCAIKSEILNAINEVENSTYRTLLLERYVMFKTWEQIAVDMNYSWRQVVRLHGKALQEIKMS